MTQYLQHSGGRYTKCLGTLKGKDLPLDWRPLTVLDTSFCHSFGFYEDLPEKNFPSVGRKSNFGFYLKAEMTIDTPGCYAFTMGSDDGSILWLDGSVLLDNGKMHRWRAVKDTVALVPGEYPLNLWYYNGMGPCGIGLRAVFAGPQDGCLQETAPSGLSLFFPSDKYRITDEHQALLLELIESQQYEADKEYIITITGFADPVGGTGYNEILSLKRAEAVAGFLEQSMSPQARVTYVIKGLGECAEGEDKVTCRRVEVTVSSSAR